MNAAVGIVAPHIKPKLRMNAHVDVESATSDSGSEAWIEGRRTCKVSARIAINYNNENQQLTGSIRPVPTAPMIW